MLIAGRYEIILAAGLSLAELIAERRSRALVLMGHPHGAVGHQPVMLPPMWVQQELTPGEQGVVVHFGPGNEEFAGRLSWFDAGAPPQLDIFRP